MTRTGSTTDTERTEDGEGEEAFSVSLLVLVVGISCQLFQTGQNNCVLCPICLTCISL